MFLDTNSEQDQSLNNKMMGILFRFRQRTALTADIEAMFHKVRVTHEHRDASQFLWWTDNHMSKTSAMFHINVHLFGGIWSPTCAGCALKRTFQTKERTFTKKSKQRGIISTSLIYLCQWTHQERQ